MNSRKEAGFTYIALLVLIGVWSISLCITVEVFETKQHRELQKQLAWEAGQYARAIESYYYSGPIDKRKLPAAPEELMEDKRFQPPAKHLRSLHSRANNKKLTIQPIFENNELIGAQVVDLKNLKTSRHIAKIY